MLILFKDRFPQTVSRLCLYHETPPDLNLNIPCFVVIDVDIFSPRSSVKGCGADEGPLYKLFIIRSAPKVMLSLVLPFSFKRNIGSL